MSRKTLLSCGAIVASVVVAGVAVSHADGRHRFGNRNFDFEISITNITKGQILSPAVVATHTKQMMSLFTLGEAASDEVAGVAEDAMLDPLIERLSGSPHVHDVVTVTGEEGPIVPGETATAVIKGDLRSTSVSLVGMLVTTNDAFYGLDSGRASLHGGTQTFILPAYDAGSEANNELCSHIPGPPCGNGGVRDTEGAEGFVHVHSGIHGVGDLDPAEHDWRNPVAIVKVRRVTRR